VAEWRLAGAGGHAERDEKVNDEELELLGVLALFFDEFEDEPVTVAQAGGVRRVDVLLDDALPAFAVQPTFAQRLDFFYSL
jgi:hypothetical protein